MGAVIHGSLAGCNVASGAWTTIASPNLNINVSTGVQNFTHRLVIQSAQLSASGGTKIRVTFKGGTTGLTIAAAYVGNHPGTGDAYDTVAQTQLTFGGSGSSGASGANGTILSDEVNFTRIAGRSLVITWYTTTGASNQVSGRTTLTGYESFYISGDDTTATNTTGYSSWTVDIGQAVIGVHLVELFT